MATFAKRIDACLTNIERHWPQYHIDGTRNIWILKPGAKSRGRGERHRVPVTYSIFDSGIVVHDRLDEILKSLSSTLADDRKYVVQKYIERPLLIHKTKFDIRQWFLITDCNPLTIWMYKDCYLRFCTEHFNLSTREQSVHLCNYSIQKHFKNNASRHVDLPGRTSLEREVSRERRFHLSAENMWTNAEFVDKYLRPMQCATKWETLIYPAMKDAIVCSMLVAQDTIDSRKVFSDDTTRERTPSTSLVCSEFV